MYSPFLYAFLALSSVRAAPVSDSQNRLVAKSFSITTRVDPPDAPLTVDPLDAPLTVDDVPSYPPSTAQATNSGLKKTAIVAGVVLIGGAIGTGLAGLGGAFNKIEVNPSIFDGPRG